MLLRIKVKPGGKKDEIVREADHTLTVKIKAPPVNGKANRYLVEYLSKVLNVPKSKIVLLKGDSSRYKTLEIDADTGYLEKVISQF